MVQNGPEFSVCGDIWNPRQTDIYCGGQCLDTIAEYIHTPEFKEIYRLWKAYHLNSMRTGGPLQEKAVNEWLAAGNTYSYGKVREYLKSINLLTENGIEYGTKWNYEEIPVEDFEKIQNLFV